MMLISTPPRETPHQTRTARAQPPAASHRRPHHSHSHRHGEHRLPHHWSHEGSITVLSDVVPKHSRPRAGSHIYLSTYLYLYLYLYLHWTDVYTCIHEHQESHAGSRKASFRGVPRRNRPRAGSHISIYLLSMVSIYVYVSIHWYLYAIFINCMRSIYTQTSQHKKKCTHWIYTIFWYYINCSLDMYNNNKV